MTTVSLHGTYSPDDVLATYAGSADPYTLRSDNMAYSVAFTNPIDMFAYALQQAAASLGRFVPVAMAFVGGTPIEMQGMLRINGNSAEFTYLEPSRGDYQHIQDRVSAKNIVYALNDRVEQDDNYVIGRSLVSVIVGSFRKTVNTLVVAAYKTDAPSKLMPVGGMFLKEHLYGRLHCTQEADKLDALLLKALAFQGVNTAKIPRNDDELLAYLDSNAEHAETAKFARALIKERQQIKAEDEARFESLPFEDELYQEPALKQSLTSVHTAIKRAKTADDVLSIAQTFLSDVGHGHLTDVCLNEAAHELIGSNPELNKVAAIILYAGVRWERLAA